MKKITTQQELDDLKQVEKDEEVIIESSETLKLKIKLSVFGKLKINCKLDCSWNNSSVVAWGNSSVVAWGNSSVVARGNSSVVAWENSSVVARGNSSVEARGNSSVEAGGNSSVEARGNSSVEARGNVSIKAIKNWFSGKIKLFDFAVAWKYKNDKFHIEKNSPNAIVQEYEDQPFLEREGIEQKDGKVILFKRVSEDYKTQEGTKNETVWLLGTIVTHKNWSPQNEECGEGKFHACSTSYFCDEFRNTLKTDKYIAIEIAVIDLFEWTENPSYPHKIAFREGKVLYQCNKFGKQINNNVYT